MSPQHKKIAAVTKNFTRTLLDAQTCISPSTIDELVGCQDSTLQCVSLRASFISDYSTKVEIRG